MWVYQLYLMQTNLLLTGDGCGLILSQESIRIFHMIVVFLSSSVGFQLFPNLLLGLLNNLQYLLLGWLNNLQYLRLGLLNNLQYLRLGLLNTPTSSLLRGKTQNECPEYDIKQNDGEIPTLEIRRLWSTSLLALVPSPLWPGMVALAGVLSMG